MAVNSSVVHLFVVGHWLARAFDENRVVDYLKLTRKEIRALECVGTKYLSPRSALAFVATPVDGDTSPAQLAWLLPARDTAPGFQLYAEGMEPAKRKKRDKPKRFGLATVAVAAATIALAGLAIYLANASATKQPPITSHKPSPKPILPKRAPYEVAVLDLPKGAIVLGGLARAEVNGEARLYAKQRRAWELLGN
jgi:hypothetical protein